METEVTAREELHELAAILREADSREKLWKLKKEKVRKPFFELITEVIEEEVPLARETVTINVDELPGDSFDEKVERWRLANYAEYRIIEADGSGAEVTFLLEEDPAIRKWSFVYDGFKFGRTYSMTGGGTDVEALYQTLLAKTDDTGTKGELALFKAIQPKKVITYELDETAFRAALTKYPELVSFVQQFIDPGAPQIKLTPITKAKEEE